MCREVKRPHQSFGGRSSRAGLFERGASSTVVIVRSGRPQHTLLRRNQRVDVPMAAIAAAEPQVDQRHVAAAVVNQRLQARSAGAEAGAAVQRQLHVSRLQRGPGGREAFVRIAHTRRFGAVVVASPIATIPGIETEVRIIWGAGTRASRSTFRAAASLRSVSILPALSPVSISASWLWLTPAWVASWRW